MEQAQTENSAACGQSLSTDVLERCGICGEDLYEHERGYCEDCRDSGDLEDTLETALRSNGTKLTGAPHNERNEGNEH